jgi:hypothetical protein
MRTIVFFSLQEKVSLYHSSACVRERFRRAELVQVRNVGEKVNVSRAFWMRNVFALITLQERNRVHPNMVSVQDSLQESLSIDLLEVGVG